MLDHPYPASGAHRSYGVERRGTDSAILGEDAVAEEAPVALVYNGFSHAVMLATPQDLEDFALGFTLSEGIAASARELHDIDVVEHALGCEVRMALAGERFAAMRERRRALAGRTGCGLCGIESLAQLQRALPAFSTSLYGIFRKFSAPWDSYRTPTWFLSTGARQEYPQPLRAS